jgi:hypothetical protein
MSRESHVAFVAVRAGGAGGIEAEGIAVGTVDSDWKYARYPLWTLQELLRNHVDPLGEQANDFLKGEGDVLYALSKEEEAEIAPLGIGKDFLSKLITVHHDDGRTETLERRKAALLLEGIERMAFFTYEEGAIRATTRLAPYVALQTTAQSKLLLFPDYLGPAKRGVLTAMSQHLEIDVAVNGIKTKDDASDREWTRLLLDLGVVRGQVQDSMWKMAANAPDPRRGAQFDKLLMRCTIGARSTETKWHSNGNNNIPAGDLVTLAEATDHTHPRIQFESFTGEVRDEGKDQANRNPYLISRLPLLTMLGLPRIAVADRDFGFRRCSQPNVAPRLVWRFETIPFPEHSLAKALRTNPSFMRLLPQSSRSDPIPPDPDPFKSLFKDADRVVLAQEQCVSDLEELNLERAGSARSVLTLEVRATKGDQPEREKKITAYALDRIEDSIKTIHLGLKRVRDGLPIS